jgi:hypothetical protein
MNAARIEVIVDPETFMMYLWRSAPMIGNASQLLCRCLAFIERSLKLALLHDDYASSPEEESLEYYLDAADDTKRLRAKVIIVASIQETHKKC